MSSCLHFTLIVINLYSNFLGFTAHDAADVLSTARNPKPQLSRALILLSCSGRKATSSSVHRLRLRSQLEICCAAGAGCEEDCKVAGCA